VFRQLIERLEWQNALPALAVDDDLVGAAEHPAPWSLDTSACESPQLYSYMTASNIPRSPCKQGLIFCKPAICAVPVAKMARPIIKGIADNGYYLPRLDEVEGDLANVQADRSYRIG
jgi:hypothetical protein